jgi:hypothetical protein
MASALQGGAGSRNVEGGWVVRRRDKVSRRREEGEGHQGDGGRWRDARVCFQDRTCSLSRYSLDAELHGRRIYASALFGERAVPLKRRRPKGESEGWPPARTSAHASKRF